MRRRARWRRFAWLERELARCALPALLVWGREDEVFDAATFAARFKKLLPHAEGPHLVTGRHFLQEIRAGDRCADRRLSRPAGRERKCVSDMTSVSVVSQPELDGTRLAFVLAEDRLGHYPNSATFFVRSFDLDRVGLAEPGYRARALGHSSMRWCSSAAAARRFRRAWKSTPSSRRWNRSTKR